MAFPTRRHLVTTALVTAAAGAVVPLSAATASAVPAARRSPGPRPLRHAHAHNDYLHPRPLHDALDQGFTSVEADIFLVDGDLLVAHEATGLDPARTLRALYLDPLLARVAAHRGSVFPGDRTPLQLLIDIKTDGAAAYRELDGQLRPYQRMLTSWRHGRVRPGAVTAVISGDRAARKPMEAQQVRHAFYDGRPEDLGTAAPASFVPLVSTSWTGAFRWQGEGPIPPAERAALRDFTDRAHRAGQRVRFWATPDTPGPRRDAVWTELLAAGVDHLNSDDLAGLARFLRAHEGHAR
ncbi:phosphatidylinositol-specific phospholipase C/glycerophosphodiester phosphodiesterase family protein [Streptomyces sp. NPDC001515]